MMKRAACILLSISLPLLWCSCSNELDYSESWIRFATYNDYGHNNRNEVTGDTIHTSFTTPDKPLILRVSTQSNNGSSPRFYMTIDGGETIEITKEVPMGGFYAHDNGTTKHIKDIDIMVPSNLYSVGQTIKYEIGIGSHSGTLSRTVYVLIR